MIGGVFYLRNCSNRCFSTDENRKNKRKNKNTPNETEWITVSAFPKPHDFIRKEENIKVILELSKKSLFQNKIPNSK